MRGARSFALLCVVVHAASAAPTASPTVDPHACSAGLIANETKECEAYMAENIGEWIVCNPCVCQYDLKDPKDCPKPKPGVRWSHQCEVKLDFDGTKTHNCALAPDREKCLDSWAACMEKMSGKSYNDTRG
jgi:hypothetical protein